MKNKIAIILVSAVTALTGVAPANAFPTVSPPSSADVAGGGKGTMA